MGNSHYIKLKIREHVATFLYIYDNKCIRRVLTVHPDHNFNKKDEKELSYYNKYSGDYYIFDGDYEVLDTVLNDFIPHIRNIGLLMEQLECECDLRLYLSLWHKLTEWKNYVLNQISILVSPIQWLLPLFYRGETRQIDNK